MSCAGTSGRSPARVGPSAGLRNHGLPFILSPHAAARAVTSDRGMTVIPSSHMRIHSILPRRFERLADEPVPSSSHRA